MNDEGATERLRLKVTAGNAAGAEIEVRDELLLGRSAPEPGKLGDDLEISREHARVTRAGTGDYLLEDLGSRNGTYINGRRISSAEALAVGDKIEVGQTTLVVQYTAPPAPPSAEEAAPDRLGPTTLRPVVPVPESGPDAGPEPTPEPVTVPEPEPSEPVPEAPGHLSLRLEVDPQSGQARLELDEGSEAVTLRWEGGRWRVAPPP
jgi:hypothetical protein